MADEPTDAPAETDNEAKDLAPEATAEETVEDTTPEVSAPEPAETPHTEPSKPEHTEGSKPPGKFKRFWRAYAAKKKLTIPVTILAILLIILAIPATRYPVLGLFLKHPLNVVVNDATTNKPISGVTLAVLGKTAQTDSSGKATITSVPVGPQTLTASKKYYKDTTDKVSVSLGSSQAAFSVKLEATGRQVPITITNKISGQGIKDAEVQVLDTKTTTDDKGKATLVLPTTSATQTGVLKLTGYNDAKITITVTDQEVKENAFTLTPAGKLYFLSKLSGKIDVVKTDLDGGNRQTVLSGTGQEDDQNTVLLASRDWKYLALQSKRDSDKPKLYLIDTANDKLTTMDEGDANFGITGWLDHSFIYTVTRNGVQNWQPKQAALKSFNAETQHITTLDETTAEGTGQFDYGREYFGDIYALKGIVLYVKNREASYYSTAKLNGKQAAILTIQADGSNKTTLKSQGIPSGTTASTISFESRAYEAGGVYFKSSLDETFYKYEDGKLDTTTETDNTKFYAQVYPTFLQSPDGKENFWTEARDGKNTLFIGDEDGKNGKQIAALSELKQYGWYTGDYLLASKNSSELYILPRSGGEPLKVSDYHKPVLNYNGYGGGYGGI